MKKNFSKKILIVTGIIISLPTAFWAFLQISLFFAPSKEWVKTIVGEWSLWLLIKGFPFVLITAALLVFYRWVIMKLHRKILKIEVEDNIRQEEKIKMLTTLVQWLWKFFKEDANDYNFYIVFYNALHSKTPYSNLLNEIRTIEKKISNFQNKLKKSKRLNELRDEFWDIIENNIEFICNTFGGQKNNWHNDFNKKQLLNLIDKYIEFLNLIEFYYDINNWGKSQLLMDKNISLKKYV